MCTRLFAAVAVVAAALLGPSAVLAAGKPNIISPALAISATNQLPSLTWDPVPDATLGFHVQRATGDCASNPVPFVTVPGGDLFPGAVSFTEAGPLPQDTYCYIVQSDDGVTVDSDPVTITYDTTPGTATLSGVATGEKHSGTLSLSATALDPGGSGVKSVAFAYREHPGDLFTLIGSVDAPGPYGPVSFDTTGLPNDTTYEIRALATDNAGNTVSDTATGVLIDNTLPTITLSGVADNANVSGSLALSATAADTGGSGLSSVVFQYRPGSSGPFTQIGSVLTTPPFGPVAFNTALLPDGGNYQIQAVATDGSGNVQTDTATSVVVDNTQPTVTLGGVSTGAKVRGTLSLSATAADVGGSGVASVRFEYRLGSSGLFTQIGSTDTTAPYGPVPFNTTLVLDGGTYQIQALATDNAGNAFAATATTVVIDNTAPAAPSPAPTGLSPVSASPTITFNAAGDALSGVNHYDVYRGATFVQSVPDTGAPAYTFADAGAPATTPPSSYSYTVKTVDNAGNTSVASGAVAILLDASGTTAPTGVTALASPTSQHPQFSWVAPTGYTVDHYKIYRNSVFLTNVVSSQTTFTDGAAAESTWSYQIRAASDASELQPLGVVSAPVAIVYDLTAPTAPGGATATAALDGSITVGWAASSDGSGSGVARYVVRRALSSVAPSSISDGDAVCQGLVTSCSDTTALNGKLYSYAVFAVDGAGNVSAAGSPAAVTARDQVAPPTPKGLAATPHDASADLHWTAAGPDDDVAGYVLVAKAGTAAPTSETDGTRVCSAIVATSTTCTASGLTNGATYTFGLFALDEALNRSQPALVSAAPNGKVTDTKAPAAVAKLHAAVSGNKVTLTWKNPSDKDFDHVEITSAERKPAALKASKRVYSGTGTKTTVKLAAGQSRWFVVVAYDAVGNASSPASVHATIKTPSSFGPAPRAKVHGAVKLSWPLAKGARYYNVQLYSGKTRILVSWPSGRALRVPRSKLKRGTKYTWYVWPGLGAKAKAHYGKLIGKNVFTFAG